MSEFKLPGIPQETNDLTGSIVDAAMVVHQTMGPGLLESIYESCMVKELEKRAIPVDRQKEVPVYYGDKLLEEKLRLDLVVGGKVIVEVKSVESLMPIHEAQLLTYLRITGCEVGFLINFNVRLLKTGIKRVALARK